MHVTVKLPGQNIIVSYDKLSKELNFDRASGKRKSEAIDAADSGQSINVRLVYFHLVFYLMLYASYCLSILTVWL